MGEPEEKVHGGAEGGDVGATDGFSCGRWRSRGVALQEVPTKASGQAHGMVTTLIYQVRSQ